MNTTTIKLLTSVTIATSLLVLPSQIHAKSLPAHQVMFILDASNSMWAQIGGRTKFDIAKEVLSAAVATLPAAARAGLVVYGHQSHYKQKNCRDIALVANFASPKSARFSQLLSTITPMGQTPIAAALSNSMNWVASDTGQNSSVVLITDGLESCGGDPCLAAKKLASIGVGTKIHVVGFNLQKSQREKIACISKNGNGIYVDARDAGGLKLALEQVSKQIVKIKAPEPPAPSRELYFEDDFKGDSLAKHWSIRNEDSDRYVVENDELLMIGTGIQHFTNADAVNIIELIRDLPKGDWDINVDLKIKMKSGYDMFEFGFYKDDKNFLALQYHLYLGEWCKKIGATLVKYNKGKKSSHDTLISGNSRHCPAKINTNTPAMLKSHADDGLRLTLSRRGRTYSAQILLKGVLKNGKPQVFVMKGLTSLRLPGRLAMTTGAYKKANGETLVNVDRVEIMSISN